MPVTGWPIAALMVAAAPPGSPHRPSGALAPAADRGHHGVMTDRTADDATHQVTIFQAVGGQPFFDRLVDRFYDRVEADDVLLRLYPDQHDLGPARRHLALFLGQYWGGPATYNAERGHPRLRMRHAPFV